MHAFAQTNIQLINQLWSGGYSAGEIESVNTSYEVAMRLFTGLFRASGKTFIAHLVGTASILGSNRVSSNIVAAGMLHAAYSSGDFGDGKGGITDAKRTWLQAIVGNEIEAYLAGYTKLIWNEQTPAAILEGMDVMGALDREVLLIRLANELEECLDLGILYCGAEKQRLARSDGVGALMIQMAKLLGFDALAIQLDEAFREAAGAEIPPSLRKSSGRNISFLIAPQSYQRVMDAVAKRLSK
ncbi:MAG: DUF6817 domain-containing protein [Chloroflexota bacterium]